MTPTADRFAALLKTLRDRTPTAPVWTDANTSDPGITIVEVLAYLAEQVQSGAVEVSPSARAELSRIGSRLAALSADVAGEPSTGSAKDDGLQRVRFFQGRLLTADDLSAEQTYMLRKLRRLHRAVFDVGIVRGLEVSVSDAGGSSSVTVSPGFALDSRGELLEVEGEVTCAVPAASEPQFILLRQVEQPAAFVTIAGAGGAPGSSEPSRIVEGVAISIASAPDEPAVVVARLVPENGGWRVDHADL